MRKHAFGIALALSILVRLVIAAVLPLTGDEAYYVFWARHPALGYYDQPPAIAWLLWPFLQISEAKAWVRLPSVLLPALVALVLRSLVARYWDAKRADLAAILFLMSPLSVFLPAITTDTPLILCVAFCVWAFVSAWDERNTYRSHGLFALSGLTLALGFLSKYFAVLLVPALVSAVALSQPKERHKGLIGLAWLLGLGAAGPLIHVLWNTGNCWANVVFNVYVRNDQEHFQIWHVALFLGQQLYLLTPGIFFWGLKKSHEPLNRDSRRLALVLMWAAPIAAFFVLSFKFGIGMHFVSAFIPFSYVWVAHRVTSKQTSFLLKSSAAWLGLNTIAAALLIAQPTETWKGRPFYKGLNQTLGISDIAQDMRQNISGPNDLLGADAYSQAALIGHSLGKDVFVFGGGSDFGRQTDFVARWSEWEGRNFVIFWQYADAPEWLREHFKSLSYKRYDHGALSYFSVCILSRQGPGTSL